MTLQDYWFYSLIAARKKEHCFRSIIPKPRFGRHLTWFVVDSPINQVALNSLLPRMLPSGAEHMRFKPKNPLDYDG